MIIEKNLKVTPEEFYEYMIDTVVEQVKNTFGRDIQPEDIKSGYSHKTQFTNQKTGSKRTTRYTVTKAIPAQQFSTVFSSVDYKTKVSYTLTPAEKGMHLVYEQTTKMTDPKREPSGIKGTVDQFILKRKLTRSIKQVEKTIRKNR